MYCPDAELKRHFKDVFGKATHQSKGKYVEVDDTRSQIETDDLILKPGAIHVIDIDGGEDKKGSDPTNEVLSSV